RLDRDRRLGDPTVGVARPHHRPLTSGPSPAPVGRVATMSLVSVAALSHRLADPALRASTVVCDVRFYLADVGQGRREYDAGHLPGARFVDLHTELAGGPGGGRHPLPPVADFLALLGRLGVTPATTV